MNHETIISGFGILDFSLQVKSTSTARQDIMEIQLNLFQSNSRLNTDELPEPGYQYQYQVPVLSFEIVKDRKRKDEKRRE